MANVILFCGSLCWSLCFCNLSSEFTIQSYSSAALKKKCTSGVIPPLLFARIFSLHCNVGIKRITEFAIVTMASVER